MMIAYALDDRPWALCSPFLNLFIQEFVKSGHALVIRVIRLRLLAGKLRYGEVVIGHGHEVPVFHLVCRCQATLCHPEGFCGHISRLTQTL